MEDTILTAMQRDQLTQLERENERLRQERDAARERLKKAEGVFNVATKSHRDEIERLAAAGTGYSQQTVDAITAERETLRAEMAAVKAVRETLRSEVAALKTDLVANAKMLARQTDLARQAEIERDAARADVQDLRGLLGIAYQRLQELGERINE